MTARSITDRRLGGLAFGEGSRRRTGRTRPAAGVEAVTRRATDGRRWKVLTHHTTDTVPLPEPAHDLLTGTTAHELPPGGCAVLREH